MTRLVHASCVAWNGRAVLIIGASGSGKSSLALRLLCMGACLVADDGVILTARDGQVWAAGPDTIAGQIEIRGVGILAARTTRSAQVALVVDLDQPEPDRLPPLRSNRDFGATLDLIYGKGNSLLAEAVVLWMHGTRIA